MEQLKQISGAVDAKLMPLLDPAQQQKFQAMREENRRQMIEELVAKVTKELEAEVR